jgi:hypothetical protein
VAGFVQGGRAGGEHAYRLYVRKATNLIFIVIVSARRTSQNE